MKRKNLVTIVVVGLLVAGAVYLALNSSSVQAAPAAISAGISTLGAGRGHVESEEVAEALGISIDELTDAKTEAVGKAIDQALDLDLITQEEADELKAEESSSRRGLLKLLNDEEMDQLDYYSFLFDALGITEEAYFAAIDTLEQTKLAEAVADGTLTQEDADAIAGQRALLGNSKFTESIKAAYEDAIAEALDDGTITQEQADALLGKLDSASFGFFHIKDNHGDGHRPGGHPSKIHDDLIPEDSETLDDLDG